MKKEHFSNCPECGAHESVKVIRTEKKDTVSLDIKKCTSCKYQPTFKELLFRNPS